MTETGKIINKIEAIENNIYTKFESQLNSFKIDMVQMINLHLTKIEEYNRDISEKLKEQGRILTLHESKIQNNINGINTIKDNLIDLKDKIINQPKPTTIKFMTNIKTIGIIWMIVNAIIMILGIIF